MKSCVNFLLALEFNTSAEVGLYLPLSVRRTAPVIRRQQCHIYTANERPKSAAFTSEHVAFRLDAQFVGVLVAEFAIYSLLLQLLVTTSFYVNRALENLSTGQVSMRHQPVSQTDGTGTSNELE